MALTDFPRPDGDCGLGFHGSASAWALPGDLDAYARWLHDDLGVRWMKLFSSGTAKVEYARALTHAGIMVIVRFHPDSGTPHPYWIPSADHIRAFWDVGVPYFEGGNEPNLGYECENGIEAAHVDKICEQWLRF